MELPDKVTFPRFAHSRADLSQHPPCLALNINNPRLPCRAPLWIELFRQTRIALAQPPRPFQQVRRLERLQ